MGLAVGEALGLEAVGEDVGAAVIGGWEIGTLMQQLHPAGKESTRGGRATGIPVRTMTDSAYVVRLNVHLARGPRVSDGCSLVESAMALFCRRRQRYRGKIDRVNGSTSV